MQRGVADLCGVIREGRARAVHDREPRPVEGDAGLRPLKLVVRVKPYIRPRGPGVRNLILRDDERDVAEAVVRVVGHTRHRDMDHGGGSGALAAVDGEAQQGAVRLLRQRVDQVALVGLDGEAIARAVGKLRERDLKLARLVSRDVFCNAHRHGEHALAGRVEYRDTVAVLAGKVILGAVALQTAGDDHGDRRRRRDLRRHADGGGVGQIIGDVDERRVAQVDVAGAAAGVYPIFQRSAADVAADDGIAFDVEDGVFRRPHRSDSVSEATILHPHAAALVRGRVAGDAAAGQIERALTQSVFIVLILLAAVYTHAAALGRLVAGDAAAGHVEGADIARVYAAALGRLVAGDAAARQGEAGIFGDAHAAAVACRVAAGDLAAADAVRHGQCAAGAVDTDDVAIATDLGFGQISVEGIAVQVELDLSPRRHFQSTAGAFDGHIVLVQLDAGHTVIVRRELEQKPTAQHYPRGSQRGLDRLRQIIRSILEGLGLVQSHVKARHIRVEEGRGHHAGVSGGRDVWIGTVVGVALGEDTGKGLVILIPYRHADVRALQRAGDGDIAAEVQVDVVGDAVRAGVAADDGRAFDAEAAALFQVHAAVGGLIAGDRAAGHGEHAAVGHDFIVVIIHGPGHDYAAAVAAVKAAGDAAVVVCAAVRHGQAAAHGDDVAVFRRGSQRAVEAVAVQVERDGLTGGYGERRFGGNSGHIMGQRVVAARRKSRLHPRPLGEIGGEGRRDGDVCGGHGEGIDAVFVRGDCVVAAVVIAHSINHVAVIRYDGDLSAFKQGERAVRQCGRLAV